MRRVVRPLLVVALAVLGARRLLYLRAYDAAERTAVGLRATYGDGCVAVLGHDEGAAAIRCRVGGLEAGHVLRRWGYQRYVLTVGAIAVDPATAQATRVVADAFAPDGRPLGSTAPIVLFHSPPRFGQPVEHSETAPPAATFPFVVALRAPRKGE